MKSVRYIICSKLSHYQDHFSSCICRQVFGISFKTSLSASVFFLRRKSRNQNEECWEILGVKHSEWGTMNNCLFSAVSIELLWFFPTCYDLCCSLDTRKTRNLCLAEAKFLHKITKFKRIARGLVPLSTTPREMGRKFAKLTQSNSDRILSMWTLHIMKWWDYRGCILSLSIVEDKNHIKYCANCHSEYVVHLAKCPHGSIYVEDSSKMLQKKKKILEYKSAVSDNDIKPTVSHHFNGLKHLLSLM